MDSLKSASERNHWGQFATPPTLSLDIARYTHQRFRGRKIRFIDPAIGTGSFYSALSRVCSREEIQQAAGVELDPAFADAASALWSNLGLKIIPADFTRLKPPQPDERFNLILTNPPYVRHHHLEPDDKIRLKLAIREQLGIEVSGLAGLYVYFLLLSHQWLADNGLAVWLIPSEFMDVNYGKAVKQYLATRIKLLHIHRFCPADVQFSDALVSSAIVIFRNVKSPKSHQVTFSFGGRLTNPDHKERVALEELRLAHKWTKFPRATIGSEDPHPLTLADLFNIKRGLATGANKFFILPKAETRRLGIPRRFLRPILPSPRYLKTSIIESNSDGYPAVEPQLALIDCDLPENEVREKHPRFWAYLESGKQRGIDQGYLTSRRVPWYSQEKRDSAPFLCTYMGRPDNGNKPFRFMWNKSAATAANVYLLLYPKGRLKTALDADASLYQAVFDVMQTITTEMFLGESRVYGGGLYKLEPKELGRLSAKPIMEAFRLSIPQQISLFA